MPKLSLYPGLRLLTVEGNARQLGEVEALLRQVLAEPPFESEP